ncbi:MAG: UDP-N-acetyl-alpha-D-glucosamine C6 dehydratase [Pelotomaculum sp. PtaB.Bin104]|nr:MAG: UDP-N-acetyl-alpha-D-glucosamine C6 dehydratase [Pelotomaculum sp. PtaB.Bin104]
MKSKAEPVLIIGAGVAGGIVADVLGNSRSGELKPIGFVDDDSNKQKQILHGLPVLGAIEHIPVLVKRYCIKKIIIAIPSASGQVIGRIIERCHQTEAHLKILPGFYDFITGKIKTTNIRDIEVDDLLGREPVSLDVEQIAGYLTNRKVLVTGAGGSIGAELSRQVAKFSPGQLILLGRGENSIYEIELELRDNFPGLNLKSEIGDIKDRVRMDLIFNRYKPNVVFHAAAHKHVPLMERCPDEAVKNNILGTKNVAESASRAGASIFILISSDKAVKPTSIMGATKRVAEMVILHMNNRGGTRFAAVRFGNVLGSRGSVIPLFKRQIARRGPITITHPDMERYFMTTVEAVQLVIQAGAIAGGGEIFILDMGQPVKILDLAKNLIRLSGFKSETDIPIRFTGIRPGEKLVEQLTSKNEDIISTGHERIFAVSGSEQDLNLLEASLNILESPSFSFQEQETITLLRNLIPDFRK